MSNNGCRRMEGILYGVFCIRLVLFRNGIKKQKMGIVWEFVYRYTGNEKVCTDNKNWGNDMKYSAIIADDEPKIILLIRQLGHFEELGIEIVDECRNGKEAYESILKHHPDFVLSDIKMPVYDGIDLIRRVREAEQDPLFVLLSGYRHFEYARSAIQLNVMDYLLKPIDEKQLNDTLRRVCSRIDQRRAQKEDRQTLTALRADQDEKAIGRFWQKLVHDDPSIDDAYFVSEARCNQEFHTAFHEGWCYEVLYIFSNLSAVFGEENRTGDGRVDQYIQESFGGHALIYTHNTFMGYVIVLHFEEKEKAEVRKGIPALYYKIRDLQEIYGEIHLNIGCSRIKHSTAQLQEAFHEGHSAEWGRLVLARNGVLDYDQICTLPRFERDELVTEKELQQLMECIKYLRAGEFGDLFQRIYQRSGALNYSNPEDIMFGFFYLRCGLMECFEEHSPVWERMNVDTYYAYLNARSFQQVIKNIYLSYQKYMQEEQKRLKEKKGKPILLAARYVKEHYADQISLEEVAEASNVSPTYLSKLFKNEMQVGFNDYLTQVRLEESEKLLAETNLSVREIAAKVGYLDEKYYSKLFKKSTGIKPTEYRRIYS